MAKNITSKKIVEVYGKKGGNISATCLALNINRSTFYRYIKQRPQLKQQLDDVVEAMYDNVESKILQKINDGDTTMTIFFAKTKMKHRGYIETQEVKLDEDAGIEIIVNQKK